MIALLASLSLFFALAGVIVWYGYRTYARPGQTFEQLTAPVSGLGREFDIQEKKHGAYNVRKFLQWVGEKVPQDPATASITRKQLFAAGFRSDAALPVFVALRLLTAIGCGLLVFTFFRFSSSAPPLRYMVAGVAGFVSFLLFGLLLEILIDRYHETLRCALPDALDLLVVAVEAGLGLDQAMWKVSEELAPTHPEISREFNLVCLEMRTGVKRADALRNMGERTMEPEIRKFVAIMVQTDKFGTSIAESLRVHSEFMRVRRRQIAEEKANKLGVKLTLVVFFFIMPAILVIAAGPAFLRIFKFLLPAMRATGG
jgi:tight adherence protein C